VYQEYAQFLRERYPALNIEGGNYPPPPIRAALAQFLSVAKIAILIMIVTGQNPFAMIGWNTPNAYTWALENKMYACMMLFFLSNAVEGQLISTGAFEVSYNEVPVWSKLENGRVPSPSEIVQIVESQVRMNGGPGAGGAGMPRSDSDFNELNM